MALLTASSSALWVRSQFRGDRQMGHIGDIGMDAWCARGQVRMTFWSLSRVGSSAPWFRQSFDLKAFNLGNPDMALACQNHLGGFGVGSSKDSVTVVFRLWLVVLVGVAAFMLCIWRWRVARALRGLCRSCGYDLRGSTGACPECGTEILPEVPSTG